MRLPRPIALAGFMGAGKTTVGRLLATALERDFVDTDSEVEAATGLTIAELFVGGREPEFRRREAEAVAGALARGPVVLALGGGSLGDAGSRRLLAERAIVVHLHVPWARLRPRIPALVETRPLLRGRSLAAVHRLYLARLPDYRSADITVDVRAGSAAAAAEQVLDSLRRLGHDT